MNANHIGGIYALTVKPGIVNTFCRKLTSQFAVMTLMNKTVHIRCGVPDWHVTTDGSKCFVH